MTNADARAIALAVNYAWGEPVCTMRDVWVVHETGTLHDRESVASRILQHIEETQETRNV